MTKGFDKHHHRLSELNRFGKDLVRRAKSKCELCGEHNTSFLIYEVPPVPVEPKFEHCIHICEECEHQINKPKLMNVNHWHGLSASVWSEVPAIKVIAVVMLKRLQHDDWASSLLEQIYLEPEIETWLARLESTEFK